MEFLYFFINALSGGKLAGKFFEPGLQELIFSEPRPLTVRLFSIFDGETGNKPGFQSLKRCVEQEAGNNIVKLLVAGGDGTVVWAISEVEAHSIDHKRLAFGVVPYGTGNDFARAIHWNEYKNLKPFSDSMMPLKKVLQHAFSARLTPHDIWNIQLIVDEEHGRFTKINQKTRREEVVKGADGVLLRKMKRSMCNYFSIGMDSRIGRNFDRKRSSSSVINKMIYLWEGFKKSLFKRVHVNKQISCMTCNDDVVFTTDPKQTEYPLMGTTAVLLAVNIPSYSSGVDAFGKSSRVALKNLNAEQAKALHKTKQQLGDGQLEFVSYRKGSHIGLDYIFHGFGKRLHQGHGPWAIEFKPLEPKQRVYFQVDGEFFVMHKPIVVTISHAKTIQLLG